MVTSPSHRDSPNGEPAGDPSASAQGPSNATMLQRQPQDNTSSTEDICVICMEPPEKKARPDCCFHHFCFSCLLKWTEQRPICPLCNQQFSSLLRIIPSSGDYKLYLVSDLPYTSDLSYDVPEQTTPMVVEEISEVELAEREERRRQARRAYVTLRNPNPYTTREAATSLQRFELYERDLWAIPRLADYREASPEFYTAHPNCIRRLIPWLNRELNALMAPNRGLVLAAVDRVLSLILNFDIRHPSFSQNLEPLLHEYTEHFIHEFYLFASSAFETMDDYDRGIEYASRLAAFSGANPVRWFRRTLRESEQASALVARAAPVADTHDSPQAGANGLEVPTVMEITSSTESDSDSDSSDCVVVDVQEPLREITTDVIELLSSDEEDDSEREHRQAPACGQDVCRSDSGCSSGDRSSLDSPATSDPFSSDESAEQPQRR